jgi:hypothetical protein
VDHAYVDIERGFPRQQIGSNAEIHVGLFFANPRNHRSAVLFEVNRERMKEVLAVAISAARCSAWSAGIPRLKSAVLIAICLRRRPSHGSAL